MIVLVVTACPVGLRGHLTRWLLEVSPGVFVGKVTTRVRVLMWERVLDMVKTGRAIMVYTADNEQGLAFEVHRHDWTPIDLEGIQLMLRPDPRRATDHTRKTGWSNASRRRKYQRGSTQSE